MCMVKASNIDLDHQYALKTLQESFYFIFRPKRPEPSLAEFLEPENESKINRQFVQGHNR